MGWMDTVKNVVSDAVGSVSPDALPGLVGQVYPGGLPGLLQKLQQTGYGQQVDSWLGRGPNEPITGADLQHILGDQHVRDIEARLGIPADQVLAAVAKALPAAADQQSPDGHIPPANDAPAVTPSGGMPSS